MKVKELIKLLVNVNPNAEVILQKDSEGNGYSPLSGANIDAIYIANSTWNGSVYFTSWSAEDAYMDDNQWAEMLNKPRCVVLFPVN